MLSLKFSNSISCVITTSFTSSTVKVILSQYFMISVINVLDVSNLNIWRVRYSKFKIMIGWFNCLSIDLINVRSITSN